MTIPKAVLFDLGGVLIHNPFGMMAKVAIECGIEPGVFVELAVGIGTYADGEHPWHRFERGEITEDDFNAATQVMARGRGITTFPALPDVNAIIGPHSVRNDYVELARTVGRAGFATAILTNNVAPWTRWRDVIGALELVDDIIDSSEVRMRKPEARIFELAARRLGVTTAECVLLDDMDDNLAGAQAVGMTAIKVDETDSAITALTDLLRLA